MRVGWMRPVLHEPRERHPRDLAPDRIKRADRHRIGGVVDDQVDARGRLDGPDVAPLAPDDAALHIVAADGHDRDGRLRRHLPRVALDRGRDHIAGPGGGGRLRLALHLAYAAARLVADLVVDGGEQLVARFLAAQAAGALDGALLLRAQVVDGLLGGAQRLGAVLQGCLARVHRLGLAVEVLLTLGEAVFRAGELGAPLADIGFCLVSELERLLLGLQLKLATAGFGLSE